MEDWKVCLKQLDLNYIGSSVKLLIDGYEVSFRNEMSNRRMSIMTYVNGQFKGEWTDCRTDAKEQAFLKPEVLKPSRRMIDFEKSMCKIRKQRFNEKEYIKESTKLYLYNPVWTSSKPLVQHLAKTFKEIQVIDRQP